MRKDKEAAEKQKLEEQKKRQQERQQELETQRRAEAAKQELQLKKDTLPPEPAASDPVASEIAFRLPSGKRLVRRFAKSCTIQVQREGQSRSFTTTSTVWPTLSCL